MKRTMKKRAKNSIKKKSSSFKSLKNKKAMCSPKEKNEYRIAAFNYIEKQKINWLVLLI